MVEIDMEMATCDIPFSGWTTNMGEESGEATVMERRLAAPCLVQCPINAEQSGETPLLRRHERLLAGKSNTAQRYSPRFQDDTPFNHIR
jgi:hypothetical protein